VSPFDTIEMCRDMVALVGADAAAGALVEAAEGYVSPEEALRLVTQPAVPSAGRTVVAGPRD
jgi:hypothetical protein